MLSSLRESEAVVVDLAVLPPSDCGALYMLAVKQRESTTSRNSLCLPSLPLTVEVFLRNISIRKTMISHSCNSSCRIESLVVEVGEDESEGGLSARPHSPYHLPVRITVKVTRLGNLKN